MGKNYCVYIITSKNNSVLYTGVTGDIAKRIFEHKNKIVEGFSQQYNLGKLVFYEMFSTPQEAILREKQIKKYRRQKKMDLIISLNPSFKDLYETLL